MNEPYDKSSKIAYADSVKSLKHTMEEVHYIPKYQRNYDWGKYQCKALFEDLKRYTNNLYKDGNSKYMFGQIVAYNSDNNKLYILDGQQRLTTATIMIAAIRNILKNIDKHSYGDETLQEKILQMKLVLLKEDKPLLNVYKSNETIFNIIINNPIELDNYIIENKSQQNMVSNYKFFYEEFCKLININKNEFGCYNDADYISNKDKYKTLIKYYDDFVDFKVCSIYSAHLREAYEMFEAINNRGITLTPLDLLKNHIYSKCYIDDDTLDRDKFEIENKWKIITDKLSELKGGIDKADKYLRYFVNATLEFVRGDDMYEVLIRSIKDNNDSLSFIERFTKALEFFKLSFVSTYITEEISGETKRILRGFAENNFDSYNPMALSVYLKNKNEKKLNKRMLGLLKAYDHFYVLNVIPKIYKTSKIEELTSKLAVSYFKNEKKLDDIIKEIYSVDDQDSEVIKAQLSQMIWSTNPAKYVLSELYNRINGSNVVDFNVIHVEHIMPKSNSQLEKYWPNISKEIHDKCIWKIGNLLLLNGKTNTKIQNKSFSFKKEWYLKDSNENPIKRYSDVNDSYFIQKDEWNEITIINRTDFIVSKIIELWATTEYNEDNEQ
ncbi:MAG: DUF262 domain-containing HNH endonuclease family protein [Lachnospiraceae bacterium]|nr:DUF262 domain-containing HNH endonuclease family protein [Lachnospiraceae bacterium]